MLIFLGVGVDFPPPALYTPPQALGGPPDGCQGWGHLPSLLCAPTALSRRRSGRAAGPRGAAGAPPSNAPQDPHLGWAEWRSSSGDPPVPCHTAPQFASKLTFLSAIPTLGWLLASPPNLELGKGWGGVSDQPPRHSQAVTPRPPPPPEKKQECHHSIERGFNIKKVPIKNSFLNHTKRPVRQLGGSP